jgi:hypothetical protein
VNRIVEARCRAEDCSSRDDRVDEAELSARHAVRDDPGELAGQMLDVGTDDLA